MNEQITEITLILRRWDQKVGLTETAHRHASLADLYGACLNVDDPDMIDRVIIRGVDDIGVERTLTLTFQSITIRPPKRNP